MFSRPITSTYERAVRSVTLRCRGTSQRRGTQRRRRRKRRAVRRWSAGLVNPVGSVDCLMCVRVSVCVCVCLSAYVCVHTTVFVDICIRTGSIHTTVRMCVSTGVSGSILHPRVAERVFCVAACVLSTCPCVRMFGRVLLCTCVCMRPDDYSSLTLSLPLSCKISGLYLRDTGA